ncbi:OmpP1/FadL family transporter [Roseovarius aestuariivivens]|uniref:OmpP1/FadL family transporter n=1 Tax=Roseovarius aestuariivivens TaxID=1888910 RepID=UPI0010811BA9|nr:outer membrane protein transport protein [Roseovarius aestuariivivens]
MKKFALAAVAFGFAAGTAHAGSIQRDGDRSQILYEAGKNYLEFSVVNVAPSVSGVGTNAVLPLAGLQSGDIAKTYQTFSLGYKTEIDERLTFAIVANNPVGADISYPLQLYPFASATAIIKSLAVTGYLKYQMNDRVSVYGGLRVQSLSGSVNLPPSPPFATRYALSVDNDYKLGYVFGGAYEIPEIALRVALTYESKIEHDFRDTTGTKFDVEIPQAVTLHARTGIAADTIIFGSARWQEWSKFQVAPSDFTGVRSPLPIAFGADDYWTYELGVGRKFSENWSGALTLGYEPDSGKPVGNLEGRDGFMSYGVAMKYTAESYDVTLGVKYFDLGSATTTTIGSNFSDNDALAVGLKVGFRF